MHLRFILFFIIALHVNVLITHASNGDPPKIEPCPVQFPCPGERAVARDERNCPVCVPRINITAVCVLECPHDCTARNQKNRCKLCFCPREILAAFLPEDDHQLNDVKSDTAITIDFCNEDKDCTAAYSYCKAKKCTCIDGLDRVKGTCVPPASSHNCPFGSPLEVGHEVKMCEYTFDNEKRMETSTCPSGYFCFVRPQTLSRSGQMVGHCCPEPTSTTSATNAAESVCPFGQPVKEARCPDTSDLPADASAPLHKRRTCPYYTHECVNNKYNKTKVCCLNPCRHSSSHFDVEGRCYDYVLIGEQCQMDAQCIGGSKCKSNAEKNTGICKCVGNSETQSRTHCPDDKKPQQFENLRLGNDIRNNNEVTTETAVQIPCSADTDCDGMYTECRDRKCVCMSGYVIQGAVCRTSGTDSSVVDGKTDLSVPAVSATDGDSTTERCATDQDCGTANTECVSGACVCGFGLIKDGLVCRHPLKIKENCRSSSECKTPGTSCQKGKCACKRNFVRVAENCIESNINFSFLSCKSDKDCKSANSTCSSSGKCNCIQSHVRDGDGCVEKNLITETCESKSDCRTHNTVCSDQLCLCPYGYTRDGDACTLTVTLKTCQSNADCISTYGVCNGGNRCTCMPGYLRDTSTNTRGVCKTNPNTKIDVEFSVGDGKTASCIMDFDCKETGIACKDGKCECMENYIKVGTRCMNDSLPCQNEEDCKPFLNTFCKQNTCQCMDGYVPDGLACNKLEFIDQTCKSDRDCSESAACLSNKCVCAYGYMRDGNICVKHDSIYMTCTSDSECSSVQSSYCSGGRCVCMKGYVRDGIMCRMPASLTNGCNTDSDCFMYPSTFCRENKCVCMSGYIRDGFLCVSYDSLTDKCRDNRDCTVNSTICQAGKCVCMAGYERLNTTGQCRMHSTTVAKQIAQLGGVVPECTYNSQCQQRLKNSVCIESRCVCMQNYVRDGETCRPVDEINEICSNSDGCTGTTMSICQQRRCVCMPGYVRRDSACVPIVPKETCVVSDDCYIDLSVCRNQKCVCMPGYVRDGDACFVGDALKESCNQNSDCKTARSICQNSKCVCMAGYIKDGGECNLSLLIKETCRLDSDCKTNGTSCRGGKCVCMPGYLRHANLCITGEGAANNTGQRSTITYKCRTNSDCTMTNAACADDECICMDGYQLDGGYCIARTMLTDRCTTNADCTHSNGTVCENQRCICMAGYRRLNSVCQQIQIAAVPDFSTSIDSPSAVAEVSCKTSADCDIPESSVCQDEKCVCMNSQYIRDGDVCVLKSDIGQKCDDKAPCPMQTTICMYNTCVCMSGYVRDGENCVRPSSIAETCAKDGECTMPGTACKLKRCVCMRGYVRDGSTCTKLETLKLDCKNEYVCPANQTCAAGKCACALGYVRIDDKTCELQPTIKICRFGSDCPSGAFCLNGKCLCMAGYRTVGSTCVSPEESKKFGNLIELPTDNDKNSTNRRLARSCTSDSDCTIAYSNCRDQICTCGERFIARNNLCVPEDKGLGESCSTDMECYMAFSKCLNRKCSCIDGFRQSADGNCVAEKYNCPYGEPMKNDGGSVVMCEISPMRNFEGGVADSSTCFAGSFCFASPHTKAVSGRLLGHCCPLPTEGAQIKPVCPVEEEFAAATCSSRAASLQERVIYKKSDKKITTEETKENRGRLLSCPASTHECLISRYLPKTICCPLPCKNGPERVNVAGKCYPRVMDGYTCELDAQCGPNSFCSFDSSGTKRCRSNFWKRFR